MSRIRGWDEAEPSVARSRSDASAARSTAPTRSTFRNLRSTLSMGGASPPAPRVVVWSRTGSRDRSGGSVLLELAPGRAEAERHAVRAIPVEVQIVRSDVELESAVGLSDVGVEADAGSRDLEADTLIRARVVRRDGIRRGHLEPGADVGLRAVRAERVAGSVDDEARAAIAQVGQRPRAIAVQRVPAARHDVAVSSVLLAPARGDDVPGPAAHPDSVSEAELDGGLGETDP